MKKQLNISSLFKLLFVVITTMSVSTVLNAQVNTSVQLNGFVRNFTGLLLNESLDFTGNNNALDFTIKKSSNSVGFSTNAYVYQYPNQDVKLGVRELYVDLFTPKMDLRIGKQQIIWGQADGVFVTDIVSPKNLSQFLLLDFNEIRMGVTAVKMKVYPSDFHDLELVWLPNFTPTILPSTNSIWRPAYNFPVPVSFDYSNAKVSSNLKNSELFARYSLSTSAVDLQLMTAYTWDDDPSMHTTKVVDSLFQLSSIILSPEHHRLFVSGASFNASVLDFVVRGEMAFYKDKYFQTENPFSIDGLEKRNYLNYVVGLDKSIGMWRLSSQFIQKIIVNHNNDFVNDSHENLITFMANRSLFREKVRLELFTYVGLNNQDALVRLRGFYFPYDGVSFELGTNVFVGEKGIFGQFNDNDMVYTRLKFNF
jgi:hypothetical protein